MSTKQGIAIDEHYQDLEEYDKANGAFVLDPASGARELWRDPITTVQREIWCPGDGNGDKTTDYYEKPGPPPPLSQRWRLYQCRTGPGPVKYNINEPPRYVILDDRAAHEVFVSDIPRAYITKYWPHDFGGNGSVRARRPNRGRGAVGDFEAEGKDRYHFTTIGNKKNGDKYYFSGEPYFKPVIWETNDWELAVGVFKPEVKKITSPPTKKPLKWNQHGHNQFTPPDQLVKNGGAPHKGLSYTRYKEQRIANRKLDSDAPVNEESIGAAAAAAKQASEERIKNWRENTNKFIDFQRQRMDGLVSTNADGLSDSKKRKIINHFRDGDATNPFGPVVAGNKQASKSDSDEGEDYVAGLEMSLLTGKELIDEQAARIEALELELAEFKKKIKSLEDMILAMR